MELSQKTDVQLFKSIYRNVNLKKLHAPVFVSESKMRKSSSLSWALGSHSYEVLVTSFFSAYVY